MEEAMKGKLIVIEGLDGSGKGTQAKLLARRLSERGIPVREISFPNYDSPSSMPIQMYLRGDFGKKPGDVNAYAASSFYAVDRFASYKQDWGRLYEGGAVIIADRYTTSNAVHQCSKLQEKQWDKYLRWLFDFEYRLMGIPTPNAVIYLQVAAQMSQKLLDKRYMGDTTKKDIHESDLEYLERSRRSAEYCAAHLGWHTVRCTSDGAMRTVEDIQREIAALVEPLLEK